MKEHLKKYNRLFILLLDITAITASYWLAFLLRFDFHVPASETLVFLNSVLVILSIRLAVFYKFDLYSGLWRYASIDDLTSIFKATAVSQIFIFAVILFIQHAHYPRSVLIIDPMLTLIFIGGIRFAIRATREIRYTRSSKHLKNLLIFGAGDFGESILRDIKREKTKLYRVAGFLDDAPEKWRHRMHGVPVFGGRKLLPKIIEKYGIDEVLVAVEHSRGTLIKNLMDIYYDSKVRRKVQFKTVPSLTEKLKYDPYLGSRNMRKIELSDLLNRRPVDIDMASISGILEGKTVLVTGAGGTIGSELCRQILQFNPKRILMLEKHNTALFYINGEMAEFAGKCEAVAVPGDVSDEIFLKNLFKKYAVNVVFHAAAHKHVPLMETNPAEAVKNNTLAAHLLAGIAAQSGVERFLYISTDKAVKPSSIMGATKRLGEITMRAMASNGYKTKFMSVRFGNVLGSSGSVIKIFQDQLARGGPITVTHPEATRYFMTTQEAIQLILQACAMGSGGEVFVLNMGTPIKVVDIAKSLIVLSGLEPDKDIAIRFTGLRPGEKLFEELFRDEDVRKDTGHSEIFMALPEEADATFLTVDLPHFRQLCDSDDEPALISKIRSIIPTYVPHPNDGDGKREMEDGRRNGTEKILVPSQ